MKKHILVLIFILSSLHSFGQVKSEAQKISNIKQFGLVWGFMKYHHPEISDGKYNWNQTFIDYYEIIKNVETQDEFNEITLKLFNSVDNSKIQLNSEIQIVKYFDKNVDFEWFNQFRNYPKTLSYLNNLKNNLNISDYYVSNKSISKIPTFENEKKYENFDEKIESHRLLSLFSFYNMIHYQYVNKYLIEDNYIDNLNVFIPIFLNSNSIFDYELSKSKLIVSIFDSHAFYLPKELSDVLFKYKAPIGIKFIGNQLVVSSIYNQELAEIDGIKLGDIITKIEGIDSKTYFEEKLGGIISHSNNNFLKKWTMWGLFNEEDRLNINIKRFDSVFEKEIKLYNKYEKNGFTSLRSVTPQSKYSLIQDDIGYINLENINKKDLRKAYKDFENTQGLIFDLRNYPKNISVDEVTKFLYPTRRAFIKVLFPSINKPSYSEYSSSRLKLIMDPFKAGKNNDKYYRGKVILLVNHFTQSQAEYLGVSIQASPNCITVGEQTAGSPMNIANFTFPDGTKVSITSLGSFYPNGESIQRKGLKIDHYINDDLLDLTQDPYLKKAIEVIKGN
ncbi:MAG: S41 family peptidase [Flavobacteriaceae bacterium]|nr:S41 family peptidase [Flavobacteriaceae bacterium]